MGVARLALVDSLALLKMLADRSRYAIYREVAAADGPLSTADIAARLDLHPNTVRLHLDKMREAGLLVMSSDRQGVVGRPQHVWALGPQAPSLGLEPAGFRLLAHLLAEVGAEASPRAGVAAAVGRRRGKERPRGQPGWGGEPRAACLRAVMDELAELGFDPALDPVGADGEITISFTRCPFRELAVLYPDLVCELHRGLTEGILAGATACRPGLVGEVKSFASLVEADPCRVELKVHS
jgi:predicted ArsR family transcriptional regulator